MKSLLKFSAVVLAASLCGCSTKNGGDDNLKKAFPEMLAFSVENTINLTRQDAEIVLEIMQLCFSAYPAMTHSNRITDAPNDNWQDFLPLESGPSLPWKVASVGCHYCTLVQ